MLSILNGISIESHKHYWIEQNAKQDRATSLAQYENLQHESEEMY